MNSSPILGIDLGTTHSLVGSVDSGFPLIFADENGRRIIPSAVYFPEEGEPVCGWDALAHLATEPGRVITSVKRLIGWREGEDQWIPPYPVRQTAQGLAVVIDGKEISPVDISAMILRHLKKIAESRMEQSMDRAVITVPAYFNDSQRNATKMAGERAGFTVERILSEPTAAALSFGLDRAEESAKIAVFDLGGGTFDISLLELRSGLFQVLSTCGDTRLGGDDFDHAVARHLFSMANSQAGRTLDLLDSISKQELLDAAKTAKHEVTENPETQVVIQLPGEEEKTIGFTRSDFDQILAPWMRRISRHCLQALSDSGLSAESLDHVVLVGGSSRIPLVRKTVATLFQKEPNLAENPDESIARGAVVQAGMLSGNLPQLILLDVTPLSLGIETFGGLMNIIVPRNTTIPAKAGEMFTNAVSGQNSMLVRILQGEREMARDNWELGQITIPFTPGPKGSARVGVQFSIDANGILSILTRDVTTGTEITLAIDDAAVNVDDAAVESMIQESVQNAFTDMHERQWTEIAMKGRELVEAIASIDQEIWAKFSEREVQDIQAHAEALRSLLQAEPGSVATLKEAVAALDGATQNLAVLLMELALEAD